MNAIRPIFLPIILAILALSVAACIPRSFKADAPAVQRIRSVAVVGFDTYVSADISSKVNKLMGPDLLIQTLSSGWRPDVASPIDSKDAYAALGDRLAQELGVRTLSYDDVVTNPVYAQLAKKYAFEHSVGTLRVDGILSGEGARKLAADERDALKKALGVDALMAIELSYWVDNSDTVSEIGGEKLWGRIDAALFDEGEDAIWRDEADGERSKSGLPPFVHQEALANVRTAIEEATQNALNLLFSRLKARCPDCIRKAPEAVAIPSDEAVHAPVQSVENSKTKAQVPEGEVTAMPIASENADASPVVPMVPVVSEDTPPAATDVSPKASPER